MKRRRWAIVFTALCALAALALVAARDGNPDPAAGLRARAHKTSDSYWNLGGSRMLVSQFYVNGVRFEDAVAELETKGRGWNWVEKAPNFRIGWHRRKDSVADYIQLIGFNDGSLTVIQRRTLSTPQWLWVRVRQWKDPFEETYSWSQPAEVP